MSRRRLVSCGIALLIALILLTGAASFYWTRGVCVRITNDTEAVLENMNLAYRQGVIHIAELKPKASCARYVNPRGESDLMLEWFDSSGTKHFQEIDVYIETNYAGSIEITIAAGNRISVTNKVRLDVTDREPRSHTFFLQADGNDVQ